MNGLVELDELIATLDPVLDGEEYVFITQADARYGERQELQPIATFAEREGLTLVVSTASSGYRGVYPSGPADARFRVVLTVFLLIWGSILYKMLQRKSLGNQLHMLGEELKR